MLNKNKLKELDTQSQVLFMWFCLLANEKRETTLSHKDLAEYSGMSRKTVITRIEVLIRKGLINKTSRFNKRTQHSNLYQVSQSILDANFQIEEDDNKFSDFLEKALPKRKIAGVVYLLKSGELHKIGRTIDFELRFKQYITESPYKVDVIHKVEVADCVGVEKHLHELMADSRVKGEWFNLDNQQALTVIKEMNFKRDKSETNIFN